LADRFPEETERGGEVYATIIVNGGLPFRERSRATPPHRQNLLDVALWKWTVSPNERLYG
jgi:hypothetical protein